MRIKSFVGLADESLIELLLAATGFVPADEENGVSLRIEGEGYAPRAAVGIKSQLLHIRVAAALQSVYVRAPELGPETFEQRQVREHCVLHGQRQRVKFKVEFLVERHLPRHILIMY